MSAPSDADAAARAAQLRARARAIRSTASALADCEATRLPGRADEETWIGPTPRRCLDDLLAMRARLRSAAEHLVASARRLEAEADLLEVSTAGGTRVTAS